MTLPGTPARDEGAPMLPPYAAGLGLRTHPFPVTPDETGYFCTSGVRAHLAEMRHFIDMRKGFMLLTGDVGLGKSTFLRHLIASLDPSRYNTALVLSSFLDQSELLEVIARDFGLPVSGQGRRIDHLELLNRFLLDEAARGRLNVLFIDDAQALDAAALDVVRQLSNLETSEHKLIQIVLCGQPELLDTLQLHHLRQVRSRIALHLELLPLGPADTHAYIEHRLARAGGQMVITAEATERIHALTGGYPRCIHHLVDRCLYALLAQQAEQVTRSIVEVAWADLGGHPASSTGRRFNPAQHVGARAGESPSLAIRKRRLPGRPVLTAVLATGVAAAVWAGWWVRSDTSAQELQAFALSARAPTPQPTSEARPGPSAGDSQGGPVAVSPPAGPPVPQGPSDWATLATFWPDLASEPARAADHAGAVQALQSRLPQSGWQPVLLPSVWETPCPVRPVLAYGGRDGHAGFFSYIEVDWPQTPQEWGLRSEHVLTVQRLMVALGRLDTRGTDGVMGVQTARALAGFQRAHGLAGTGQPDGPTAYLMSCAALALANTPAG